MRAVDGRSKWVYAAAIVAVSAVIGAGLAIFPVTAPSASAAVATTIGQGQGGVGGQVTGLANVTVRAGGERNAAGSINPLAGVSFEFFQANANNNGLPTGDRVSWCTTDSTGACNVALTPRSAGNSTYGYIAVPTGVPGDDYYMVTERVTGGSTQTLRIHGFQTGPVSAGGVYELDRNPSAATSRNQTTSGTAMAASRNNPALPAACGLNVALLLDLSTSVRNAGAVADLKNAAKAYVNAVTGTSSRVALVTFGRTSPSLSVNPNTPGAQPNPNPNRTLGLTSVATATQAQTVINRIDGLIVPDNNATNWDAGFRAVRALAGDLDQVIMITDGLPTRYNVNGDGGDGSTTRYIEIEHAIASANAIKAAGVNLTAIGIGAGINQTPANLSAVSGPGRLQDYFHTPNFGEIAAILTDTVLSACESTVHVTKSVIPASGAMGQRLPASGWQISASASDPIISVDGSGTPGATSANTQTGATGVASFELEQEAGTFDTITIREQLQPDTTYVPEGLRCVDTANPDIVLPVVRIDEGTSNPGFSVRVDEGQTISCEIVNRATEVSAQLTVDKRWYFDLDGAGGGGFGDAYTPDDTLPIDGLTASLTLTDGTPTSGLPAGPHAFGTTYGNLNVGGTVTIGETVSGLPVLCTNAVTFVGAPTSGVVSLSTEPNQVTVENRVTCDTRLTMEKSLLEDSENVNESNWSLNSFPIGGENVLPGVRGGITGELSATAPITPDVRYALQEVPDEGEPADDWVQDWTPTLASQWHEALDAGASGSWQCNLRTALEPADGESPWSTVWFDGRNGGVTVPVGSWVRCVAFNAPEPELSLRKEVVENGIATEVPIGDDRWTLTATWASGVGVDQTGDTPIPFRPPRTQVALSGGGGFAREPVVPGIYTLTEAGEVPGHDNGTQWTCTFDRDPGNPVVLDDNTLSLTSGQGATCVIQNTAVQPTLQLLKTVDGPDENTNWVLTGTPATGSDSPVVTNAAGGNTAVTDVFTGVGYTLSEAAVDGFDASGYEPGDWACIDTADDDTEVPVSDTGTIEPLEPGQAVVCTITNTATAPTVALVKVVAGDDTLTSDDWILTGVGDSSEVNPTGTPGNVGATDVAYGDDITLSEAPAAGVGDSGYAPGDWACVLDDGPADPAVVVTQGAEGTATLTGLAPGQNVTCTITNTAIAPTLELTKSVTGNGTATADDWVLAAVGDAGTTANPAGTPGDVPAVTVTPGESFELSEGPADGFDDSGYTRTGWTCEVIAGPVAPTPQVTQGADGAASLAPLAPGQQVRCTAANQAIDPLLNLVKTVVGDPTVDASDWVLQGSAAGDIVVNAAGDPGEVTGAVVPAGVDIDLTEAPNGWDDGAFTRGSWSCVLDSGPGAAPTVTGGEDGAATITGLQAGQEVTCAITNTAVAPTLQLVKTVDGPADATEWTLTAEPVPGSGSVVSGAGGTAPEPIPARVEYALSETGNEAVAGGYTPGEWSCEVTSGPTTPALTMTQTGEGTATISGLAPGQNVVCTIENTVIAPTLALQKTVTGGGPATADDWSLNAAGDAGTELNPDGEPGDVPAAEVGLGESFDLSEAAYGDFDDSGYSREGWTCEVVAGPETPLPEVTAGADGAASLAPLAPGQQVLCIAENRAIDPLLSLVKVVVGDDSVDDTSWVLQGAVDNLVVVNPGATPGNVPQTVVPVGADIDLSESAVPGFDDTDFAAGSWYCELDDGPGAVPTVTGENGVGTMSGLEPGQVVTCIISNTALPPVLELSKTADPPSGSSVLPGSTITYTLVADNTGTGTLRGAIAYDDLSEVIPNATIGDLPAELVQVDDVTLRWEIPDLAPGAQATVSYTVTVNDDALGQSLRNVVSGDGVDVCVDDDDCEVVHHVPAWTLAKSADPDSGSAVRPGDTVTYTLTASNTGPAPVEGATATDDLTDVLSAATLGDLPAGLTQNGTSLDWAIPDLGVGETATISYTVTVSEDAWGATLRNSVVGTGPVTPEECTPDEPCVTEHPVPLWTLTKTSDPASGSQVDPGATITYTLTVLNDGPAPIDDAIVTDDLSGVLQNADLPGTLPDGLALSGTTLTWQVPALAVGEEASVSYTVTVHDDAYDATLRNAATAGPGGGCDGVCETEHTTEPAPVPPPVEPLPPTGGTSPAPVLWLGLGMLTLGAVTVVIARRRRVHV